MGAADVKLFPGKEKRERFVIFEVLPVICHAQGVKKTLQMPNRRRG
jgi:hypothetical protein